MIYFISDTHFYHDNIIKYCNRPFDNIYDMNEAMINNWNSVVKETDTIYHLGDFCLGGNEELENIYSRLNGNKILIRGNHDRKKALYYESLGFIVLKNAPIILEEYKLMLSHTPLPDAKILDGYINIHGHIHNKSISEDYPKKDYSEKKHINVSVDVSNFKPISLNMINEMRCKKD